METSAPEAAVLSKWSGRVAGVNSQLLTRVTLLSFILSSCFSGRYASVRSASLSETRSKTLGAAMNCFLCSIALIVFEAIFVSFSKLDWMDYGSLAHVSFRGTPTPLIALPGRKPFLV
jgi:hypothetical protein